MLTQIYEISTPEEASALSAIGVDHIGVLVGDGQFPRELPISAASRIGAAIVPPSKFSALFLTRDLSLIASWARELNPAIVHLGASAELLSPQDVASLKRMLPGIVVMRSIPVFSEESVAIAESYVGIADFLLLDSYRSTDKQIGALGVTHDWNISRRIVDVVRIPVVLAGGLGPDNVAGAIQAVRPAGVDSKTKTDQDGSHAKDLERVRRFHEAARAAADNRFPSA
ncbi:phosphoribosylanthranilate isomerase [Bradyrhizobium sp. CNPSo 4010]|uniref:N-(5'-phosphoribosyl)anthranilate isomerase n=1 Tax=Bradyrhizobium agreste TaxID=2751811 RepID=A0ABS0PMI0_9BRAD|nr:phosphoribosylanthranilate isomerase [Bradyrhizobium agreste]MBH5398029.1 phosphoribosylanthranilate isomerase [Bradyrhizobium agreste]